MRSTVKRLKVFAIGLQFESGSDSPESYLCQLSVQLNNQLSESQGISVT